jgi:hypothetical protein
MSKKEQISGIFICLVLIGWIVLITFLTVNASNKNSKLETRIEELETVIDELFDDLDDEFYFIDEDIKDLDERISELARKSNQNQFIILKGKVIGYVIMPDAEIVPKIELENGTIAYLPITNKAVEIGKEVYIIGVDDKYVFIEVENE